MDSSVSETLTWYLQNIMIMFISPATHTGLLGYNWTQL